MMFGPQNLAPQTPRPFPLSPGEVQAAVAQFHAVGIYGWPLLGGGYLHVSDWAKQETNRWHAIMAMDD